MKNKRYIAAGIIAVAIVTIHLVIAAEFYFIGSAKITDFFFWQAKKNELFKEPKHQN